ncbi:uncharacterized protein KQ657_003152 [Scheffersomyces spartinae]|uniref:Uncharacterized protein n=1 Tax=Scheffersomyces spartinae TaxID=45513 RepID=A0A9P8AKS3_9ASCO|nr:uncharacterized protein KQ657_003152 [Scheffersomyces spartinae]KAG7195394.1 hypothetical protein KQ657_003152 [Scheffersomyces spartinae]
MDKENQLPLESLTMREVTSPRKLFPILAPVNTNDPAKLNGKWLSVKERKERIISETTGLVKLSLANGERQSLVVVRKKGPPNKNPETPKRNTQSGRVTSSESDDSDVFSDTKNNNNNNANMGLPMYLPIRQPSASSTLSSSSTDYESYAVETESQLFNKYCQKHKQLIEMEKSVELLKFELLEISHRLEEAKGNTSDYKRLPFKQQSSSTAVLDPATVVRSITKKASSMFSPDTENKVSTLTKKASSIFQSQPPDSSPLKNKRSVVELFSKLQDQFNTNISEMKQRNDELTNNASKFMNGLINNLSPKKQDTPPMNHDASLILDDDTIFNNSSAIFSEDSPDNSHIIHEVDEEEEEVNFVDIDDYELELDDY